MNRQVKVVFRPASEANFVQFFEDLNNLIIFEGFKMRKTVSLVPANRWNIVILPISYWHDMIPILILVSLSVRSMMVIWAK